jgi:hypothetical protein
MNTYHRWIIAVVLCVIVLTPGVSLAQDENWVCEEGPNDITAAAKAALDNGDLDSAWWLASRGEALCRDERVLFQKARSTRHIVETRRGLTHAPEPGMVELDDGKLFMNCFGEGSPAVIFESGFGGGNTAWQDVQPAISTYTRTCSYDRRGIGLSFRYMPEGAVRTTQDQVDDLVALLDAAGIEPPYILVGHSIAGLNLLVFTGQNPDWVQGLVLVDVVHPDQERRFAEAFDDYEPFPPPDDSSNLERLDFDASFAEGAQYTSYGDRPLSVITAGVQVDRQAGEIWNELQAEYPAYSTNSRHVIAEKSRHFIMDSEPWLIIDSVLWVLDEVHIAEME